MTKEISAWQEENITSESSVSSHSMSLFRPLVAMAQRDLHAICISQKRPRPRPAVKWERLSAVDCHDPTAFSF